MNYLSVIYLFIAFTIIIYLKGWKKGLILGIITLILMILLSWAEDILFNNSSVIAVIMLFIISFLYEFIEKYIKSKNISKTPAGESNLSRQAFPNARIKHGKSYHTFRRQKNKILRKELKHKKKNFHNKREP